MLQLRKILTSLVGKKLIMAVSGLGLVLFVVVHLAGNLPLYTNNATAFNLYTQNLEDYGWLLEVAEVGLFGLILVHAVVAIALKLKNRRARGDVAYQVSRSKGGPSKNTIASRNMATTGIILLAFLALHIIQFKLGPGVAEGYATVVNGRQMRDMHRVVLETFKNPLYVVIYSAVMALLGMHLRHGFWSAFQSASVAYGQFSCALYRLALALALVVGLGFFFIPIVVYFDLYKVFA